MNSSEFMDTYERSMDRNKMDKEAQAIVARFEKHQMEHSTMLMKAMGMLQDRTVGQTQGQQTQGQQTQKQESKPTKEPKSK